jgi:hypothetical protein
MAKAAVAKAEADAALKAAVAKESQPAENQLRKAA